MGEKTIQPDALARGIRVLKEFSQEIERHGLNPADTTVLATSAFRNALNTKEVLREIEAATGLLPKVISGEEEAALIFAGVYASGVIAEGIPSLVMDIGGGSVEFIIWDGFRVSWKRSFEIGGLRMMEDFHQQDPLPEHRRYELEAYLTEALQPLWNQCRKHEGLQLVGSSGSFDSLADVRNAMAGIRPAEGCAFQALQKAEFDAIFESVWHLPLDGRLQVPGMTAYRAGMMAVALILIRQVMQHSGVTGIFISHYAMKEGAFIHELSNA
jgi:exopolyphosphatase/guanosine-5'-triphosphate,3'-diphosphate pyrophosphatase